MPKPNFPANQPPPPAGGPGDRPPDEPTSRAAKDIPLPTRPIPTSSQLPSRPAGFPEKIKQPSPVSSSTPPPEEERFPPEKPQVSGPLPVKPPVFPAERPIGEKAPPQEAPSRPPERIVVSSLEKEEKKEAPPTPSPPPEEKKELPIPSATPPPTTYVFAEEGAGGVFKKIFIFLLLILILAGAFFGIYKFILPKLRGVGKPQEVSLTYWGLWEPSKVFQQVVADFQKEHPGIKINYVQNSHKDYRERLASSFAKGEGPDIFRFHNTWVPMFKKELAPVPAEAYNAGLFEATFYPVARGSLRQGTNYVGIPLEIDGLGLFINEEIFSSAGKEPPTTWDELRRVALELTAYDAGGNIQIAGVAMGRTENVDHWSDILAVMMLQNGADLENPTGKLAEDALTYFTNFSKQDKVWSQRLPSSTAAFANGKLAMYFGPSWRALNIKEANPSLKFKIVPIPQLPETNITWGTFWAEGVWEKSKNKKEAWEFLKYLSSKSALQKLYQAQAQVRLFGEPYSRVDMADLLKTDKYLGAYISQAPAARSWYLCSRTFDNGINDKIIKYFEDAVNAVNQGKTSKEALAPAAQGVAQVLAQYGLSTGVVR